MKLHNMNSSWHLEGSKYITGLALGALTTWLGDTGIEANWGSVSTPSLTCTDEII